MRRMNASTTRAVRSVSSLSLLCLLLGCGPSEQAGGSGSSAPAASGAGSAKPAANASAAASAKPATSSAVSATPSATSAVAAPKPEDFGPDVTKDAVEAINASFAYDTNQPNAAIDGKIATAWSAPPSGAWLEVGLYPGTRVDGIELDGARADKNSNGEERWDTGGVIKKVKVEWDGGSAELTFDRAKDKGVRKKLPIGATTRKLRLSILEVDKGSKSDDIDVDELKIFGATTGLKAPEKAGLTSLCKADAVAVRFKDGAVYGGEWSPAKDAPEKAIHWDFAMTKSRVDDGEWHTLGLKYVDNTSVGDDGAKVPPDQRAVGKIFRFRVQGETFEGEMNGAKSTGKCGVTMTGKSG